MDSPTYEQWMLGRLNNAAATAQNMPGGPEASARHLTMQVDPRIYEQQMFNYDFANPSGSTMVGRDALAAKAMPTAEEARSALLESQRMDAAARGGAAAVLQEQARAYREATQPKPKRKKKTYTSYGAYEEEVPPEPQM